MTDEDIRNLWRSHDDVIDFARAIEQKVREECAVICENNMVVEEPRYVSVIAHNLCAMDCAEAIRSGGKND